MRRLLERNPDITPAEYEAISKLMTKMQNEMHSYNPRNPVPEAGMEALSLVRSLVNEVRNPNQIAEAVSAVSPYISSRETTTALPYREPQQQEEQSNLEKGLVGALKGVVGVAVTGLGVLLAGACLLSGGWWMELPLRIVGAGLEIGAEGAKDIYDAGDNAINGKEPEPTAQKSESVEHQKGMKSALGDLKEIAAQKASRKSQPEPDEPEFQSRYEI